jgi:hypothetical protein
MLMSNRRLATAAGLLALVVLPAVMCAQVPNGERVAAARELMQIAGVAKQFDELMPYLTRQLTQSFTAIAPDKATEIGEVLGQLTTKFVDREGELIDEIAALYPNGSRRKSSLASSLSTSRRLA